MPENDKQQMLKHIINAILQKSIDLKFFWLFKCRSIIGKYHPVISDIKK